MKGTRINFSKVELSWIRAHRAMPRREAHAAYCAHFQRTDVTPDNYKSLCTRKGWKTGRDGRIKPGNVPPNKGKKMPYNPNRAATQFKKGHVPINVKFLGHERVSKDGYVEISVAQKNPHTGYERRYVLKHRNLWENQNGPIPSGMCLKCLDGNKLNTAPSNWTLVPRGALPFMNGHRGANYNKADPRVRPSIIALAKLRFLRKEKTTRSVRTKVAQ